ncbi:MAG TPA: hypothetical protein VLA97_07685 [Nocardioidaceae bacterium]|nr:hypothetical protein [Nocardioidaceae bacterium]
MEIADIAEELYALPPGEFTTARNDRAKAAKGAGDKALAEEVKRLPKPATAAWAVNMLVRHEAEQMGQVLDLGASLRQAQLDLAGDDLRELGKQRRRLTAAVTTQARKLARELGQKLGDPVADQVQETLHAAMVDEAASVAVRTGLLVRPLSATGVGAVDLDGAVAVPAALGRVAAPAEKPVRTDEPVEKPSLRVIRDTGRAREEARRAVAEAETEHRSAEKRLGKAEGAVSKLEARDLQLRAELEELQRRVAELEHRIETTDDELEEAENRRESAKRDYDAATGALTEARERLRAVEEDND